MNKIECSTEYILPWKTIERITLTSKKRKKELFILNDNGYMNIYNTHKDLLSYKNRIESFENDEECDSFLMNLLF